MFEENENPVIEDVTENTEETVEETDGEVIETTEQVEDTTEPEQEQEESFTRSQVDEMIAKKLARKEARIRKEYEKKYSRLETVVNTGLGTNSVEESTNKLEQFYKDKGIEIPSYGLTDEQAERLALLDAEEVISGGYDEVKEEVDRLTELGFDNMSSAEKKYFLKLADYRQAAETEKELRAKGISKDEMETKEFKDIMSSLNPNLSTKAKLDLYLQLRPKKEVKKIGSVKSGTTSQIKDYYTPDEVRKLTPAQLKDPKIMAAVEDSMAIWYRDNIQ